MYRSGSRSGLLALLAGGGLFFPLGWTMANDGPTAGPTGTAPAAAVSVRPPDDAQNRGPSSPPPGFTRPIDPPISAVAAQVPPVQTPVPPAQTPRVAPAPSVRKANHLQAQGGSSPVEGAIPSASGPTPAGPPMQNPAVMPAQAQMSEPAGGPCDLGVCKIDSYFYTNGWFFGADYMYLRPTFETYTAALERTTVVAPNGDSTITDTAIPFGADYESTFRLFGGYRWGTCGESITFSWWRINSDGLFASNPVPQDLSVIYAGPFDNNADAPGERLFSSFDMNLNVWDIDYSKRIPICTATSCKGDCWCPDWDVMWSVGARIVDFERSQNSQTINAQGASQALVVVNSTFSGAGPRLGGEVRRYLGETHRWSLYGKGYQSLVLGEYHKDRSRTSVATQPQTTSAEEQDFTRIVPISELEVGVSRQIGCRTLFTAGYQFQAWWQITGFEAVQTETCGCSGGSSIMSFDGLFVRLERTWGGCNNRRCDTCQ